MKKKMIIAAILAMITAVPVFAATTEDAQGKTDWFTQMSAHHQQMVQQAVDSGRITADQAAQMNEHMKEMAPIMQKMMQNGPMMGNQNNGMMGSNAQNGMPANCLGKSE